jgi:broad specificity phosphatase PhoE
VESRARTLLLVRHGTTEATRRAAFGSDEPLDRGAWSAAEHLARTLGRLDAAYAGPARAASETARALGVDAETVAALADCAAGRWTGRTLAEVEAEDPDALAAWLGDADVAAPGGESMAQIRDRVRGWLEEQADLGPGRVLAVTHAATVRAAVAHVLRVPHEVTTRVDVAPLSVTEISVRASRWRLVRLNCQPAPAGRKASPHPLQRQDG